MRSSTVPWRAGAPGAKAEIVLHAGVDEKSFTRGHRHFALVNDLDRGRVLLVAENRGEESRDALWSGLFGEQRNRVQAVAMGMWDPYVNSARRHLPAADSKIVFDKFHIAERLSEAVDLVRRREKQAIEGRLGRRGPLAGRRWQTAKGSGHRSSELRSSWAEPSFPSDVPARSFRIPNFSIR